MINIVLSILSGLLLTLCFPKFDIAALVWVAVIPFFLTIYWSKNYKQILLYSFIFGMVYFLGVFYWISSLSQWVGMWGFVAWIGLSIYQSLYIIFFAYLSYMVVKFLPKTAHMLIIPLLWVALEWVRPLGGFGVPGALLGYTQHLNTPLIQISRFTGIYGISFLIVLVNLTITVFIISKGNIMKKLIELKYLIGVVSILLIAVYAWGVDVLNRASNLNVRAENVSIALIQPNIDQRSKLNPRNALDMVDLLSRLSREIYHKKPKIIIWPETAVVGYLELDKVLFEKAKDVAKNANCYLITGAFGTGQGKIYNSMFAISPRSDRGKITSRYDKEHLMPFGEYLPFRPLLYPLLKGTGYFEQDQSPNRQVQILKAAGYKIGGMICFESLFDYLAKERSKGSDFLLTITNDAWFGDSAGAAQHIMAGPFRAVENRMYFVQAANTGISAVIDPFGRFVETSKLNERSSIVTELHLNSDFR